MRDHEGRVSWEGWGSRGRAAVSCPGRTAGVVGTAGSWFAAGREIAGSSGRLAAAVLAGEGFAAVVVFAVGRCSDVAPL